MDYFIADTHLGHKNIVEYCGRPFSSYEEMDRLIIGNWNRYISNRDTVYFLGDFALVVADRIREYVSLLQGKKIMIMGNHDRRRTITFWKKAGFIEVYKEPMFLPYQGVVISHEPVDSPNFPNVHGHTHGNLHRGEVPEHGIHICVSVEVTDYCPVSEEWINQEIIKRRENG